MWLDWTKRRHRGLRTWILYILKNAPKNGAEIMDAMEAMSQGWWRPSPGSVYPMLNSMESEGLIKKMADGAYEITEQGKVETDWPSRLKNGEPRSVDQILGQMSSYVSYLEDLAKGKNPHITENSDQILALGTRLRRVGEK
jgi:DNA-binding PadR family transcriptional regulator